MIGTYVSKLTLALFCLAACAPVTLQHQVKTIGGDDSMGTLDASLRALPKPEWSRRDRNPRDPAIAFSGKSDKKFVSWRGYDGREMCAYSELSRIIEMDTTYAREVEQLEEIVKQARVVFGAYDALEAIPQDWPAPTTSSRNRITKKEKRVEKYQDGEGDWHDYHVIDFEMEFCGPAPAVSPSTRVVTLMGYGATPEKNSLYAWKIEGTPQARDSTPAPVAAPASPGPSTGAIGTVAGSASVVSKRSIPVAMKDQGGYLGFLSIVDCAKKYNELNGGKLSVLAFTDPTIMKLLPDQKARTALKERGTCSAIYSAHVATQVSNEGGVLKAVTLDGQTREVSLDPSVPIIEAKNGTIYPVQALWRP